jgi:hypothetical protein
MKIIFFLFLFLKILTQAQNENINIEFYFLLTNENSYKILIDFIKLFEEFKKENITINFYPNFITQKAKKNKEKNCISNDNYCIESFPEKNKNNGTKFLLESLFQYCFYYYDIDLFFNYINYYYYNCEYECEFDNDFKEKCGYEILKKYNLTSENITNCIINTFEESDDVHEIVKDLLKNENEYFKNVSEKIKDYEIKNFPAFNINNNIVYKNLNYDNIFINLCKIFNFDNENIKNKCFEYLKNQEPKKNNFFKNVFFIFILFVIIILIIIYFYYNKFKIIINKLKNNIKTFYREKFKKYKKLKGTFEVDEIDLTSIYENDKEKQTYLTLNENDINNNKL